MTTTTTTTTVVNTAKTTVPATSVPKFETFDSLVIRVVLEMDAEESYPTKAAYCADLRLKLCSALDARKALGSEDPGVPFDMLDWAETDIDGSDDGKDGNVVDHHSSDQGVDGFESDDGELILDVLTDYLFVLAEK